MVKNYRSFAATVIGGSHEKAQKICQDYSAHHSDNALEIAAVADGHGDANCFRSDKGARFAVDCAIEAIKDFVDRYKPTAEKTERQEAIGALVRSVVASWHEKVEQHYRDLPFADDELAQCDEKHRKRFSEGREQHKAYGATLIAAAITGEYWFGFHIGDGRWTVLQDGGKFAQPVAWDDRCFLNVTTSICDFDSHDAPRVYCALSSEEPPPIAVFLCSDGIDDNYPAENNEQHLYRLYAQVAIAFAEDGFDSAQDQVGKLCERFARDGKGDDTSLAMIVDMERVKAAAPDLREWLDEEKVRIEAAKREEREREERERKDRKREKAIKAAEPETAKVQTQTQIQSEANKAYGEAKLIKTLRIATIALLCVVAALGATLVFSKLQSPVMEQMVELNTSGTAKSAPLVLPQKIDVPDENRSAIDDNESSNEVFNENNESNKTIFKSESNETNETGNDTNGTENDLNSTEFNTNETV
ncbi:hypothetical protein FACS189487_06850 [Campylobacterota bacterium]|nr:hypothetical protein FACS189487_06850 [Campylobacterota bacterium]